MKIRDNEQRRQAIWCNPAYAETNPEADSVLHYHREFLEVYSMTYAEERQYWLERT